MTAQTARKRTPTKPQTARLSSTKPIRHKQIAAPTVAGAQAKSPAAAPLLRQLRRRKIGRLHTLDAVAREMKRVYKAMRWGEIPPQVGTKLVFVLRTAAQTMVDATVQRNKLALVKKLEALGQDVRSDPTLPPPDEPADLPPIDMEPSA